MTSERTADEQLVANIRADLVAQEHLHAGTSYGRIISDKIAALDRLVARNQQLQEALDDLLAWESEQQAASGAEMLLSLHMRFKRARAALASVRARTPE